MTLPPNADYGAPSPYYEADGITIYHGDCRVNLPALAVAPDVLVTDPPYGIGYSVTSRAEPGVMEGDTVTGDDELFDPRWLLDYGRCVIFGANYFAHLLPPGGWIVWSKAQDNRWANNTRSLAEVAWTNCHRYVALWNCFWAGSPLYREHERGAQLHPTQKPLSLMRWIVEQKTKPGDLVLDPYMGSGPVARAAQDTGRRYVGVEIEERYCEVAVRRLGQGVLDLAMTEWTAEDDAAVTICALVFGDSHKCCRLATHEAEHRCSCGATLSPNDGSGATP